MSRKIEICTYVQVDLRELDLEDLQEELEYRGYQVVEKEVVLPEQVNDLITSIFEQRRIGKDYQQSLDDLIYLVLGRVT